MDRRDTLLAARGLTDGRDRLLSADEPLAELHERCGGSLPGTLAVPELLELVRQGRRLGLRIAREFSAFDGEAVVSGFVRIHPLSDDRGGGCEMLVENWQRNLSAPDSRELGERLDAIDRATAEVNARLDANQRVQVLNALAPDAEALQTAAMSPPGRLWSELVDLEGVAHRQPLHWRLLDGVPCRFAGSNRSWRVRLIPLGASSGTPSGFELLLVANEPFAAEALPPAERRDPEAGASRLLGKALVPVLRPPIARVIANAETISARLAGPLRAEYSEYAATIASAGQHLSAMLDDLADLEVVEAPGFKTARDRVDLFEAAQRAAGILGVKARARAVSIEVQGERGNAVAIGEFRRVLQVLINLIGNAITYSPEGSTVRVAVSGAAEGRVAVTVADEGRGVTPAEAQRIFDKFERLGRDSEGGSETGSGLGLYISRRLAEAMRGTLTVATAESGGALFRFELAAA